MVVVAWRWRSDDDGAMVWWHLFMEMTAVRGRWALIFLSPFTQFATNDWPMMDLKHVTELNFFLFTLPCHAYFLAFFMSFCSRMLSEDTPHFVILGYCAFCISSWYWWFSLSTSIKSSRGFWNLKGGFDFTNPSRFATAFVKSQLIRRGHVTAVCNRHEVRV